MVLIADFRLLPFAGGDLSLEILIYSFLSVARSIYQSVRRSVGPSDSRSISPLVGGLHVFFISHESRMQYLSCKRIRFKVNSNNAILIKKMSNLLYCPKTHPWTAEALFQTTLINR